jgi:hypothetical protein
MRRLQQDLGTAVGVATGDEVRSPGREELDGIGDKAAVHRQNVTMRMVGGRRAWMKLQSGEIENIVPGEMIDRVMEDAICLVIGGILAAETAGRARA